MPNDLNDALANCLMAWGDDELILGHRDSEWCGHAPILEEDIAFANLALDEVGHALIWYGMLAELCAEDPDTYPDQLVYQREAAEFRNAQMLELPNGDWAFSMLRQYLFDSAELVRLGELSKSIHPDLAAAATRIRREELYHHRHTSLWVLRLALGTAESHQRMQTALDQLWPFTQQLFEPIPGEAELAVQEYLPDPHALREEWNSLVCAHLREGDLAIPGAQPLRLLRQQHTPHLKVLISELQSVARLDLNAVW